MTQRINHKCDRACCEKQATKKAVVKLRSNLMSMHHEVFIPVRVCDSHATNKDANDLIEGANAKAMMQDIFKVQTQGGQVDWSCSGASWVGINDD